MRKLKKIFSLLLVIICVLSIFFFCIKACGVIQGARASQEEIIARELTTREQQKIFILENFGDYKTYKLMVKIANCESGFNQDAVNLKSRDFGLFQISEKYWDTTAQSMGLDYKNNWKDNVLLAKYILETQKPLYSPWWWSRHCWK